MSGKNFQKPDWWGKKDADFNCGLTSIRRERFSSFSTLTIQHAGNMGSSIERSVDPNLKIAKLPSIKELKEIFPTFSESGSPDYFYIIKFKIKE